MKIIKTARFITEEELKFWSENIPGGRARRRRPRMYDQDQLEKGIDIEMEHVEKGSLPRRLQRQIATEIAMDHLEESKDYSGMKGGKYYDMLQDGERKIEERLNRRLNRRLNNPCDWRKNKMREITDKAQKLLSRIPGAHGSVFGSCGHKICGCRCSKGEHVKIIADFPCGECQTKEEN
jgi:hypothetical protein